MTKEKTQARREQLARLRAEQKRKERRGALLMWGVGGLVIVLVVGLVGWYLIAERSATSLDAVKTFKYIGNEHTSEKVTYKENPPVGGPHRPAPEWQNCGIYDKPVANENAVHSLEHGTIWITYQPNLPADQVEKLRSVAKSSGDYMLLSPYEGLPAKIVATAWGNQLTLDKADDPRLPRFIAKYKNGSDAPEPGALCTGGVGTPIS
ncbi:DUF3105 domain-containing protein [Sinosporangium siamense]|uniref:Membrane protein n=1 Tax=Sinosporangium siamense TaxID=1367973 RepID=A0A919RAK2_9ACTN|nr:DUF3105 domain-containing protein [Sinosporangium siamense]GII90082.1 membrane protein [Sinosporangium siamense]